MNLNVKWLDFVPGIGNLRTAGRLIETARELNNQADRMNNAARDCLAESGRLTAHAGECLAAADRMMK